MGDGRWGGSDTGGESAEYTETGGEGAYRKKRERIQTRCLFGARSLDESRRGEKEGTTSSPAGKHRKLTLRGQSLEVTLAYALGWNYTTQ